MSTSSEDTIRRLLTDDLMRLIARYCKTPRTSSEIVREAFRQNPSSSLDYWERTVSNNLSILEEKKGISYADGKWKTTQITLDVLQKYFGA